jgi:hypothetical protein
MVRKVTKAKRLQYYFREMKITSSIFFFLCALNSFAQEFPYTVVLNPVYSSQDIALQSFAYGTWENRVLLIGGRKDGLHERQPFAAFDVAGMPSNISILDLNNFSSTPVEFDIIDVALSEQFSSTNIQFYQTDSILWLVGGYGYSNTAQDHITYPMLTAINLKTFFEAQDNGTFAFESFDFITDERFAVTGGSLKKLNDVFYLAAGQRFDGRYNPMNNPTFTQTYTEKVSRFIPTLTEARIQVEWLPEFNDPALLHRRDLNVVEGIDSNGQVNFTLFSGVFQQVADLPFTNCVEVNPNGIAEVPEFQHLLNQYHCGHVSLYDAQSQKQHYLFLGGISEYYYEGDVLTQNVDVPFTKNIACVTRDVNNQWVEELNPSLMPGFLGSSSEIILNENLPMISGEIVDLNSAWNGSEILLGHLLGGIRSTAQNIFWVNNGTQSFPNDTLYEVWLVPNSVDVSSTLSLPKNVFTIYPNPTSGKFRIEFSCQKNCVVELTAFDSNGKLVSKDKLGEFKSGKHSVENRWKLFDHPGTYILQLKLGEEIIVQKLLVEP